MTDIFDEVEEDLRRQRAEKFWKNHWPKMAAIAVVVIVGVGGWRFYEWREESRAAAAGARFDAAVESSRANRPQEAAATLEALATDAPAGYRILARFRQAAERAATDAPAAVALYDALAADAGAGALMQDIARIRAASLLVDTAPPTEIARRVEAMAAAGQPFRHSAREILALSALRANDRAGVERWIGLIQGDTDTPPGLRGRAELIAAVVAGMAQ